jgi:hypothetical protein
MDMQHKDIQHLDIQHMDVQHLGVQHMDIKHTDRGGVGVGGGGRQTERQTEKIETGRNKVRQTDRQIDIKRNR